MLSEGTPMTRTTRPSILLTGLLAAATFGCAGPSTPVEPVADTPLAVSTSVATVTPVADRLEAGGVVAAAVSATVTSRIIAPVAEVRVRAGDRVRTGDVLVVLEDADAAARARQADASVQAAQQGFAVATTEQAAASADQTLADAWHTRMATLHDRRSATTQELDEATARLSGANARRDGAKARVEQAGFELSAARAAADAARAMQGFSVIRAPFDGLVTERLADPGSLASPGMPLLRLDSLGVPHVDVSVDEARVSQVHVGDAAEVVLDADAESASDTRVVNGVVTEIARMVDAGTRAFIVKVSLPGDASRTGTFARARFRGASRDLLLVPADAVRRQGQLAMLFVVEDGRARLRLVQTGYEGPEGVEILAGLDRDERVVTAPPPDLADGRAVTVSAANLTGGRS
jgi:RND family efflux transporter MFP subunit